jgi:hypothetical protein
MSVAEFHARIDDRDADVGENVADEEQQRRDDEDPEHDRIVARDERFVAEQPESVDVVDALDQERARQNDRDVVAERRGDRNQAVRRVAYTAEREALGDRRANVSAERLSMSEFFIMNVVTAKLLAMWTRQDRPP